jgi:hypothetical protein
MKKFIINKNKQDSISGENYEVHNIDAKCTRLPKQENQINLGYHHTCRDAIQKAKELWPKSSYDIDGCFYCTSCHKE